MASSSNSKMISLKTADGNVFEVEPSIAKQMLTVQNFIDEAESPSIIIPLPNINSKELVKIIEYCKHHHSAVVDDDKAKDKEDAGKAKAKDKDAASSSATKDKDAAKDFDVEFTKELSHNELFGLILAANYLNMKELLDFLCQTTADLIKDKSPEFVRNLFSIENDYTPEEEAEVRKENAWAFEDVKD